MSGLDLLRGGYYVNRSWKAMASSIDALLLGKLGLSAEQQELVRAKMLLGLPCTFCFLFEGETDLQYHHTGECHPNPHQSVIAHPKPYP